MTVAFSHDFGAGQWLGADVLLTARLNASRKIVLTHGVTDLYEAVIQSGHGPIALTSKLSVYGTFAIAWAGQELAAIDALSTIESLHALDLLRWEDVERELSRVSEGNCPGRVCFIVHRFHDGNIEVYCFGEPKLFQLADGGSISTGSGAEGFMDFLSGVKFGVPDYSNAKCNEEQAVAHAKSQGIFGLLLASEMMSQVTLAERFGGLYETARLVTLPSGESEFVKVDDFAITYWSVRFATPDDVAESSGRISLGDVVFPSIPHLTAHVRYLTDLPSLGRVCGIGTTVQQTK